MNPMSEFMKLKSPGLVSSVTAAGFTTAAMRWRFHDACAAFWIPARRPRAPVGRRRRRRRRRADPPRGTGTVISRASPLMNWTATALDRLDANPARRLVQSDRGKHTGPGAIRALCATPRVRRYGCTLNRFEFTVGTAIAGRPLTDADATSR